MRYIKFAALLHKRVVVKYAVFYSISGKAKLFPRAKCGWMETSNRHVLRQKQKQRAFPLIQDKSEML